jgi:hypothetical protein
MMLLTRDGPRRYPAQLLDMPAFRAEMGAAAAEAARRNLDSQVMIRNLQSWCSEAHSAWHAPTAW